jgi:serine/threonine protein kinase
LAGQHILVFEYLPNGSLYDRLHSSDALALTWKQRVKIAIDVACGLEYLHHEADPPLVHRDVKSQNILLTEADSAKVADFGLSKAASMKDTHFQSITTAVRGTIGYLDPQYFSTGILSPKSDVYSFGVVLLELITGEKALSLSSWTPRCMTSPSLYQELVDKKLDGVFDPTELEALVDLSKMCREEDSKMRPSMRKVVALLRLAANDGEDSEASEEIGRSSKAQKMESLNIDIKWKPQDWSHGNSLEMHSTPEPKVSY